MRVMLDAALGYLERGWSVIPLEPKGKKPLLAWTPYQSRHATRAEVEQWWKRWPEANVGVATGQISGIVVLDVDGPEGDQSLQRLHVMLPPTIVAFTGKGLHYYFKHPSSKVSTRVRIHPGLDVRGDGGYVVAPPSSHPSGKTYRWAQDASPADMDVTLIPTCLQSCFLPVNGQLHQQPPIDDWIHLLHGVNEGARNAAAARIAGRFLRRGFTTSETTELLLLWNSRNRPPLDKQEIVRTVLSIAPREIQRIQS